MSRKFLLLSVASMLGLALSVPATFSAAGAGHSTFAARRDVETSRVVGSLETEQPNLERIDHDVGELWLTVSNYGLCGGFGDGHSGGIFPAGSRTVYLGSAILWVGSIDEAGDTLVSAGFEGWGLSWLPGPLDGIDDEKDSISVGAGVSEQDYLACYSDTATSATWPELVGPAHVPQGIEVAQRSYAWGVSYVEDIVVLDFTLRNVGERVLHGVYLGLQIDAECCQWQDFGTWPGGEDDVSGFRRWRDPGDTLWPAGAVFYSERYPSGVDVGGQARREAPADCINLAWGADGTGVSKPGNWHTPGAIGIRPLRASSADPVLSYNWWVFSINLGDDWGPTDPGNPRDVCGSPEGDPEMYILLANGSIDPDQLDPVNGDYSVVEDVRALLSLGPLYPEGRNPSNPAEWYLAPGDSVTVTFAVTAGEEFHIDYHLPPAPEEYGGHYDFADLATNAYLAYRIFDTPGLDSDGDGYRGAYVVYACGDTVWVTGDGVPDVAAAADPPAEEPASGPPAQIGLLGMWPNPCEDRVMIRYALREPARVEVKIYNLLGQLVATVIDGVEDPGVHDIVWDTRDLSGREVASGIYYCRYLAGRVEGKASFVVVR